MASALAEYDNLALILVPVDAHSGTSWLNGHVPGVTVKAQPVPAESMDALKDLVAVMYAALHPETTDERV